MGVTKQEVVKANTIVSSLGGMRVGTLSFEAAGTYNALSRELVGALEDEIRSITIAASRNEMSLLVITGGSSTAFCSGANLKERESMGRSETVDFVDRVNDLFDRIEKMPLVTLAAINGAAFGGGLELALACDLRVAAETAQMGLTETSLGIIPGAGGTYRLLNAVTEATAKEAILTARKYTASEAHRVGLIHSVLPAQDFLEEVNVYIENHFSHISPFAMKQAKRAFDAYRQQFAGNFRALERSFYLNTLYSVDRKEGLSAFLEKRKPHFTGEQAWTPES